MRRSRARTVVNWKASSVPVVSVDVVIHVRNNRTVPECNATAYSTAGRRPQGSRFTGQRVVAAKPDNFVILSAAAAVSLTTWKLGWAGLGYRASDARC